MYRINMPMPLPHDPEFHKTPTGMARSQETACDFFEAEKCRRWHALILIIKALQESVEDGIMPLETAFLPHLLLPSGLTIGEWAPPQIESAYATGQMLRFCPPPRPWGSEEGEFHNFSPQPA